MKHLALIVLSLTLVTSKSFGQELEGTKALSMGGAFRGLADDHGAIDYNPAGIKQAAVYSLEFLYENAHSPDSQTFRGSIIDTLTLPQLGMGFSFSHEENDFVQQKIQLALAGKISFAYVGTTLRHVSLRNQASAWTNDVGLLVKPLDRWLSMGLVGHNFAKVDKIPDFPRQYALGLSSQLSDKLHLTGDLIWEPESISKREINEGIGLEFLLSPTFPIRMGYLWDEIHFQRFFTAGFGWMAPRFVLQYGMQLETDSNHLIHSLCLSVPL